MVNPGSEQIESLSSLEATLEFYGSLAVASALLRIIDNFAAARLVEVAKVDVDFFGGVFIVQFILICY